MDNMPSGNSFPQICVVSGNNHVGNWHKYTSRTMFSLSAYGASYTENCKRNSKRKVPQPRTSYRNANII